MLLVHRTIHGAVELTWIVSCSGTEIEEPEVHGAQLVLIQDLETDISYQLPNPVRWLHAKQVDEVTLHGCTWKPCFLTADQFCWWFSGRALAEHIEEMIWPTSTDEEAV